MDRLLEYLDVSPFLSSSIVIFTCDTRWNRVLPILVSIWCIGQISLICSLLKAITEVDSNLNIICEVIVDMEDRSVLMYELKEKVLSKIECFDNQREVKTVVLGKVA